MAEPYDSFVAFATASSYPSHSGIEIPQLWSPQIAEKFYNKAVLPGITTGKYNGQIMNMGDNLVIRVRPTVQNRTYVIGQALQYDVPQATTVVLPIDKGRYWGLQVDDVDAQQMDKDWTPVWQKDAAENLSDDVDAEVLAALPSACSSDTTGTTAGTSGTVNLGVAGAPISVAKTTVIDRILGAAQVLDEMNCPDDNRFIVIPPWMRTLLLGSDIAQVQITGDPTSPLRNGVIGTIDRFTIHLSNNVSHATDGSFDAYNVLFGWKDATAFAQTIIKTEKLRSTEYFGDLIRGLQVYGYKVIQPTLIGNLYCYKA